VVRRRKSSIKRTSSSLALVDESSCVRGPNDGELIFYDRPDGPGPRHSDYLIARTEEPGTLLEILTRTVGTSGVVRKRRSLYLVGQTRIHIDQVDGLGEYLELEVILAPGQSDAEGENIAMANKLEAEPGRTRSPARPLPHPTM
jgi:adenylate cyclase class IV